MRSIRILSSITKIIGAAIWILFALLSILMFKPSLDPLLILYCLLAVASVIPNRILMKNRTIAWIYFSSYTCFVLYWMVYEFRAFLSLEGFFSDGCFALFWWLPAFSILLLLAGQKQVEQQAVGWKILKKVLVITFLVALSIPVVDYICYVWPPSDEEFARSVHLDLAASDKYDKVKTMFYIRISSSGRTIWPPSDSTFHMWIDGKMKPMPHEWPPEVYYSHILPSHPRGAAWWMTLDELKDWIGEGEHILQFQFRNVKSNELKIIVPPSGRVKCDPEADMGDWEKVR